MAQSDEGGNDHLQENLFLADTLDELLDRLSFIADATSSRETKVKLRKLIGDVREKLAMGHKDFRVGLPPAGPASK